MGLDEILSGLPLLAGSAGGGGIAAWALLKAAVKAQQERLVRVEIKVDQLLAQVARLEGVMDR